MGTLMVAWETAIALSHFHVCSPFATKVVTKSFPDTARVYDDTFQFFSPHRARARASQHQHLMTQLPFLIKGDAWPRVGVFMLYRLPLYHSLPSLMPKKKKCLYCPSKYYREREAPQRFILTFYIDNLFQPFRMKNAYCMTGKHAGETE